MKICLLKHALALTDYQAKVYNLHYLHTKERQKVDFALVYEKQVEKMIEVKYADAQIQPSLRYFSDKYQFPAVQVVKELKRERVDGGIEILDSDHFLSSLYL